MANPFIFIIKKQHEKQTYKKQLLVKDRDKVTHHLLTILNNPEMS